MRKLLWIILGVIAAGVVYATVDFKDLSLSLSAQAGETLSDNPDEESDNPDGKECICLDTMMKAGGNAIGWDFSNIPGKIMLNSDVVADNPLLSMDSVSPTVCRLNMITRQADFDLTDKDVMARIRQFNKPLDGFSRFQKVYVEHFDSVVTDEGELLKQNTIYAFTLDCPNEGFPQRRQVLRWLGDLISIAQNMDVMVPAFNTLYIANNRSKYKGQIYTGDATDIDRLGEFVSKVSFSRWKDEVWSNEEPNILNIHIATDLRAHVANHRYVTYGAYAQSNQDPGHGMYTENFYTFDLKANKMVNNDYLFKKGSMDEVKKLLFAEMAKDENYRYYAGIKTAEEVAERVNAWKSMPLVDSEEGFVLPQGALANDGVVFSFQPYEIECFAAGAFHFTVPYAKLLPYLTSAAKNLIKPQ